MPMKTIEGYSKEKYTNVIQQREDYIKELVNEHNIKTNDNIIVMNLYIRYFSSLFSSLDLAILNIAKPATDNNTIFGKLTISST